MLAEVTARDARIQQLADEGKHAQQALATALQQLQSMASSHKHESDQVGAMLWNTAFYSSRICSLWP